MKIFSFLLLLLFIYSSHSHGRDPSDHVALSGVVRHPSAVVGSAYKGGRDPSVASHSHHVVGFHPEPERDAPATDAAVIQSVVDLSALPNLTTLATLKRDRTITIIRTVTSSLLAVTAGGIGIWYLTELPLSYFPCYPSNSSSLLGAPMAGGFALSVGGATVRNIPRLLKLHKATRALEASLDNNPSFNQKENKWKGNPQGLTLATTAAAAAPSLCSRLWQPRNLTRLFVIAVIVFNVVNLVGLVEDKDVIFSSAAVNGTSITCFTPTIYPSAFAQTSSSFLGMGLLCGLLSWLFLSPWC